MTKEKKSWRDLFQEYKLQAKFYLAEDKNGVEKKDMSCEWLNSEVKIPFYERQPYSGRTLRWHG